MRGIEKPSHSAIGAAIRTFKVLLNAEPLRLENINASLVAVPQSNAPRSEKRKKNNLRRQPKDGENGILTQRMHTVWIWQNEKLPKRMPR
jgi:hypothetical protein